MSADDLRDALHEQLPALFEFEPQEDGRALVHTPLQMPDGTLVTVWIDETGDCPRATDGGEALFVLRLAAPDCELTPHLRRLVNEAAAVYGVAFERGEVVAPLNSGRNLAETVLAVAQASLRVSCLAYACRDPEERNLHRELGEVLSGAGIRAEGSVPCTGASGREWPVSYVVDDGGSTALIVIVSGGTPGQASAVAEYMAPVFEDLRDGSAGTPKFIAVFDDTEVEWPDDAIRRLAEHAEAVPWSRLADLPRMLAREAAAVG